MAGGQGNQGIVVSGRGSIRARDMAVGNRAQVIKIVGDAGERLEDRGLEEVHQKLDALLEAVTANADSLDNTDDVLDSTKVVAEELAKEKPNKLTLMAVLDGIATGVKSVTGIAVAAEALKLAVTKLL